jgi:hypothetical protein
MASIVIWFLTRENFGVLRGDFLSGGVIASCILLPGFAFLSRWYYGAGVRLSKQFPRFGRTLDTALPFAVMIAAGAAAMPDWNAALVQIAAAALGIFVGYARQRRNVKPMNSKVLLGAVMFASVFGMTIQPEFLRFGQIGHLTIIHLLFLSVAAMIFALYFASHFIRPTGFMGDNAFKKFKLIGRCVMLLILALFAFTESELIFAALFLIMLIYFAVSVRHTKSGSAATAHEKMWRIALGLFGILSAMPVLTGLAIVLHRADTGLLESDEIRDLL